MGLADVRAIREHQFARPIEDVAAAEAVLSRLDAEEVTGQGIGRDADDAGPQCPCQDRGGAPDTRGAVRHTRPDQRGVSRGAPAAEFGFVPDTDRLIIDLLTSEAIGETGENVTRAADAVGTAAAPDSARMYS